jgi:hypothetical protein
MRDEGDEPGTDGPPQPAGVEPQPGGVGPQPSSVGAQPAAVPQEGAHPRRWFLATAGAVVAGAGGGVAAFARRSARPIPHRPPQVLLDAFAAEQRLIASAGATARAEPAARSVLTQVRNDHQAHLAALRAQLSRFDPPTRAAQRRATAHAGASVTARAALADAERTASAHAAARAFQLASAEPTTATLLASIAASEAGHVLLLQ